MSELIEAVRLGAQRHPGESWDRANERHAEEFVAWLGAEFPGRVFQTDWPPGHDQAERILLQSLAAAGAGGPDDSPPVLLVERQLLPLLARRTTGFNYVFTVPGERLERLILIAHYDTWRGPGADDNTTGEEIVKQYLVADLRKERRPPLTHTYILAGSEECGLVGLVSQVVLALGLGLANVALTHGLYATTALALALVPLANFRFGVSGSREYVRALSAAEMALVQAVVSVDSVGEGRLYIPESTLGADFVRAFLPFAGYESLNDVLKEGAHLHGIKYNTFIVGGTTDHVSFLEVGNGWRDRLGEWLGCPRWLGCHRHGKRKVPAAALVALAPGKASPLVFGGKIHTASDTADRVFPRPLGETLRVLDYFFHVFSGGSRPAEPRTLEEYHYARLFRVQLGGEHPREEHWLALKDAVEPNRRNVNGVYRVEVERDGGRVVCQKPRIVGWGVETRLPREVSRQLAGRGSASAVNAERLEVETGDRALAFVARPRGVLRDLETASQRALGELERFMGGNTFLAFFAGAFLLARAVELLMAIAFAQWPALARAFFAWFALTLPATLVLQLAAVLWLVGRKIPAMVDNSYKHLNRADNLGSLKRAASG